MRHGVLAAWLSVTMLAATPVHAQFGGLLKQATTPKAQQSTEDNGGCPKGKKGSSVGRSILGGVVGSAVGKTGLGNFIPTAEVAGLLTDAIACRLDPKEQKQAADATDEVTRGETVGTTTNWTSETRPGVSGSSTVAARNDLADGTKCMNVTDIIIVEGEETKVTKKMCKGPGQSRYALAA
jgi:surface antigen